jgi:hypothetical protein
MGSYVVGQVAFVVKTPINEERKTLSKLLLGAIPPKYHHIVYCSIYALKKKGTQLWVPF